MTALGSMGGVWNFSLLCFGMLLSYVHPEVSHYQPSPPCTVARCSAKAHPLLGGAKPSCGGHILGRGGANGMVDGWFVSYLLA